MNEEARNRLEEARMGKQRAEQEVLFWSERIKSLEDLIGESHPLKPAILAAIDGAKWTEKTKDFAWAFIRNQDGSERRDVLPLVDAIKAAPKGRLEVNGIQNLISSNGKFLQRRVLK